MQPLDIAMDFFQFGVATIPCIYGSKQPRFSWSKYITQMPTEHQLRRWFKRDKTNIAVITGWNSLFVLDFESNNVYLQWYSWLKKPVRQEINKAFKVTTGNGIHVYVSCLDNAPVTSSAVCWSSKREFDNATDDHNDRIDIKAGGGYVITAPSLHPSGRRYKSHRTSHIPLFDEFSDVMPVGGRIGSLAKRHVENSPWATKADNLKSRIRILDFFPDARQTGNGFYMARCLWHKDNNPSMWIDTTNNKCGCYSGCNGGRSMDVIDVYCKINNVTYAEAMIGLRQHAAGV